MIKIKELFISLPRSIQNNNPLYLLAQEILPLNQSKGFILSTEKPQPRYGISINEQYLDMKNDLIPNFEQLGPNEKYLINSIMFNEKNLLYLIGGIGVGKTSFCYLFKNLLQNSFKMRTTNVNEEPLVFLFDIFQERGLFENLQKPDEFRNAFINYFSNKIIGEIQRRGCFNIDKEVSDIWDNILDNKNEKDITSSISVLDFMRSQLHENDVSNFIGAIKSSDDNKHILEKRKQIRKNILKDESFSLSYIAILLHYIKNYYHLHRNLDIYIIIDNIDPEPPALIRQMNDSLRRFASLSGIKTIICTRQTTWNQTISYDVQDIPAEIAYTGPDPIQILERRLLSFEEKPDAYKDHFDEKSFEEITSRINELRLLSFKNEIFCKHLKALCGNSIRKAILLGHNLICNSLYDLLKIDKKEKIINGVKAEVVNLGVGDLCRAVVVGRTGTYEWRQSDFVENLFQVYHNKNSSKYLMKLRLLKAIKNYNANNGITLNNLMYFMKMGFRYDESTIVHALNELKQKEKRLIWSDTVRYDFDDNLLENYGRSYLHLSSAGQGYVDTLFGSFNYIEEVMMDTFVNAEKFGKKWNYNIFQDRLNLLYLFLDLVSETDVNEVKTFIGNLGIKEYEAAFGEKELISKNIFESVKHVVELLLRSWQLSDVNFIREHLLKYDTRIMFLDDHEKKIFKNTV
jgi:hypothetical protein